MQTAGLTTSDIWSQRVMEQANADLVQIEDLDCDATVMIREATLGHHDAQRNYRPYLHLSGDLISITPAVQIDEAGNEVAVELPWGITEVTYQSGQEKVDVYYEFTDDQLAVLAQRGYFSEGFSIPDEMIDIPLEFPVQVDGLVLGPSAEHAETNAAIVFLGVRNIADLRMDKDSSGYSLEGYFPQPRRAEQPEQVHEAWSSPQYASEHGIDSLFTDAELGLDQLEDPVAARAAQQQQQAVLAQQSEAGTHNEFDALAQQAAAGIEAEEQAYREELAEQEGTDENVYAQRVAAYLQASQQRDEAEQDSREMAADLQARADASAESLESEAGRFIDDEQQEDLLSDAQREAIRARRAARRNQELTEAMDRQSSTGRHRASDQPKADQPAASKSREIDEIEFGD